MTTRTIDPVRFARFSEVYTSQLIAIAEANPSEYPWYKTVDDAIRVASKMCAAFESGSYNLDGRAIKAACKIVGIKHTRTAIEAFLKGQ